MAKVSDMFANEYLTVDDLSKCAGRRTPPLTIMSVTEEDMGNRDKLVVSFVETPKRLPLNKTNAVQLSEELGDETDGWRGSKMVLGVEKTMFQGKRVDCIRVVGTVKGDSAAVAAAAAAAQSANAQSDSAIPF
jgi:hypothetical protein